jgi:hypothetical protein
VDALSDSRRPIVVFRRWSRLRSRIWKSAKKTKGTMNARSAASQMGMMFFRSGYAN